MVSAFPIFIWILAISMPSLLDAQKPEMEHCWDATFSVKMDHHFKIVQNDKTMSNGRETTCSFTFEFGKSTQNPPQYAAFIVFTPENSTRKPEFSNATRQAFGQDWKVYKLKCFCKSTDNCLSFFQKNLSDFCGGFAAISNTSFPESIVKTELRTLERIIQIVKYHSYVWPLNMKREEYVKYKESLEPQNTPQSTSAEDNKAMPACWCAEFEVKLGREWNLVSHNYKNRSCSSPPSCSVTISMHHTFNVSRAENDPQRKNTSKISKRVIVSFDSSGSQKPPVLEVHDHDETSDVPQHKEHKITCYCQRGEKCVSFFKVRLSEFCGGFANVREVYDLALDPENAREFYAMEGIVEVLKAGAEIWRPDMTQEQFVEYKENGGLATKPPRRQGPEDDGQMDGFSDSAMWLTAVSSILHVLALA